MGSSTEYSAYGPDRQPVGPRHACPAAAAAARPSAVAAYHAPFGIGTDTGGSIRQPAALCGIVGLKPTYGRVSRYGIVAFASSLDQIGPLARDARDAAALLHAVAGRDDRDSTSAPRPVPGRAAAPADAATTRPPRGSRASASACRREYFVKGMEPGVEAAHPRGGRARSRRPARRSRRSSLPHTDYGLATYYIVAPAEASANLARYDGVRYGHSVRLPGADFIADYLATRGEGFGRRGEAPDHARDVRPVGRLLRRVLPQGAEGPDADQARLRRRVRGRHRRPRGADLAVGRVQVRRADSPIPSRCTSRTRARCP